MAARWCTSVCLAMLSLHTLCECMPHGDDNACWATCDLIVCMLSSAQSAPNQLLQVPWTWQCMLSLPVMLLFWMLSSASCWKLKGPPQLSGSGPVRRVLSSLNSSMDGKEARPSGNVPDKGTSMKWRTLRAAKAPFSDQVGGIGPAQLRESLGNTRLQSGRWKHNTSSHNFAKDEQMLPCIAAGMPARIYHTTGAAGLPL